MTKKKHEELVEEMAKKIWAVQAFPRGTDWDRAVEKAEQFITLILSAFHDGGLDKELGVVGRWMVSRASPKKLGLQSWSVDMSKDKGATTFIALRPLPGMKEKT